MFSILTRCAAGLLMTLFVSNLAWSQSIATPRSIHPTARRWLGDNIAVYLGDLPNRKKAEFLRKISSTEKVALIHIQGKTRKFDPNSTFTYYPGNIEQVTSDSVSGQFGVVIHNTPGTHARGYRYPREMKLERVTYVYLPRSCQILLSL